jgi:hypothetical protein
MLHPTRLSLSISGATPQAASGHGKLVEWTHHRCVCEWSWECPPCGGAEWVRWLRSPPHTRASPVTGCCEPDRSGTEAGVADRSVKPSEPVPR